MSSGEIVCCVFFSGDQLFRVEKLSISSGTDLINNCGFQVYENTSRNVFSGTSFVEESGEGVVPGCFLWELAVRGDTVFQAKEFPAGVTYLNSGLTNVD